LDLYSFYVPTSYVTEEPTNIVTRHRV